jgi:hypothetical protein
MYNPETKGEQVNRLRTISSNICYEIVQKIIHERIIGHINTNDEYNWLVIDICKNLIEGAELEQFKKIVGM